MKATSLLLLAATLSGSVHAQNLLPADDFPNLPPGFMLPLLPDGTASINGRINSAADLDVFGIRVGANATLTVSTAGNTDTNGTLKRQTATGWVNVITEEGGTGNFRFTRTVEPGLYAIQVGGRLSTATATGEYGLKVALTPGNPPPPAEVPDIDIPEIPRGGQLAFGAVPLNTSITKSFTIRNTGNASLAVTGVTLTGPSTDPAAGNAAGVTGLPFLIEGGGARTILPGASITARVVFKPLNTGAFMASVTVLSTDPDENPWIFTVTGSGQSTGPSTSGEIEVTLGDTAIPVGGEVGFGEFSVPASAPVVRELLISNSGDTELKLGGVQLVELPSASPLPPAPPGFFRILTPPAASLAPGRSTALRLGAGGPVAAHPGRYTIQAVLPNSDSDENPYRLLLTATVVEAPPAALPEIDVLAGESPLTDDGVLDLGSTKTGIPLTKTVTLKNSGPGTLHISGIAVEWSGPVIAIWPPPPLPFILEGAEPRAIAPGASSAFRVLFPAHTSGNAEALLHIRSNDTDENPFSLTLKAAAEGDPVPPRAPEIAVSMENADLPPGSTIEFGRTPLRIPVKRTVTIANQGTAPLSVRAAIQPAGRAMGAAPLFFRLAGPPFATVAPGSSKACTVVFQPLAGGTFETTLIISSNDQDENPYRLKLIGKGGTDSTKVPDIALSLGGSELGPNGTVDFGTSTPGLPVTKEISISNTGTGDLRLGRISFSRSPEILPPAGAAAANVMLTALPFRAVPPPGGVIAPGGSAILRVIYTAPASGSQTALLCIESSDPDENPRKLILKGTSSGEAPAPPEIAVSFADADLPAGGSADFGDVAIGGSVRREIKVTNSGTGDLRISGFSVLPASFAANDALVGIPTTALVRIVSGPGLIAPGTSAVYVLEMLGYSPGAAVFHARITNNDADENPYLFTVKGNVTGGIVPPVDDPPLFLGPPVAVDPAAGNP